MVTIWQHCNGDAPAVTRRPGEYSCSRRRCSDPIALAVPRPAPLTPFPRFLGPPTHLQTATMPLSGMAAPVHRSQGQQGTGPGSFAVPIAAGARS